MAQFVEKNTSAAPAAERETSDMEVLHPERTVILGGEEITVREYGNVEWLRLLPTVEPMVSAVTQMLASPDEPNYEVVLNTIAVHTDQMLPLVLQTVGRDLEWLETLPPADVESLLMVWWGVNYHFFVQRAQSRRGVELESANRKAQIKAQKQASAGVPSTPPSSRMATDTPISATTQPGN